MNKAKVLSKAKKQEKAKEKITKAKKPIKINEYIIGGIIGKNGEEIVEIDLRKIENSICDYYIICQGNSGRQVKTIADGIEEYVRKKAGYKPSHFEGYENAEWILLDYNDTIVHIFQPEIRNFFQIESLWADAKQKKINPEDYIKKVNKKSKEQ